MISFPGLKMHVHNNVKEHYVVYFTIMKELCLIIKDKL